MGHIPARKSKMVYQHHLLNRLLIAIIATLSLYLVLRALLNFAALSSLPEIVLGIALLLACLLFYKMAQPGEEESRQREQVATPKLHEEVASADAPLGEERRLRAIEDMYRRAISAANCVL